MEVKEALEIYEYIREEREDVYDVLKTLEERINTIDMCLGEILYRIDQSKQRMHEKEKDE